jgi:hypothetical protein
MRRKQLLDADGLRLPVEKAALVSDPFKLIGDYSNPILKPAAAEAVKKHGELENKMGAPTPSNQCWPQPVPYVFWQLGMQMLQQADKLTILYGNDQQVRHIRLNATHELQVTPSWYGDSVGHYEGDTLVIDTVGIKPGPFPMVDMYGTPRTGALHVVERYRLVDYEAAKQVQERAGREIWRIGVGGADGWTPDPGYKGKGLQLIFTVEDAGVFNSPWSAIITYRHAALGEWPEFVCAENIRDYAGTNAAVPTADKPDF